MTNYSDNYAQAQERAAMLAAPERPSEGYLTYIDQMVLGRGVRIDIPVHKLNVHQLAKVADHLHGLANAIAFAGQRTDLPIRLRLSEVKSLSAAFNRAMREMVDSKR